MKRSVMPLSGLAIRNAKPSKKLVKLSEAGGGTEGLYKSLTYDRGKELMDHRRFTLATDIEVYFCD